MCWWGKFAFTKDEIRLENQGFFHDDNGYTEDNITELHKLEIGDTWRCPDYGNCHLITRVQDIQ